MKERTKGYLAGVVTTAVAMSLVGSAFALQRQVVLTADYTDIKIKFLSGEYITPRDAVGNEVEPFAVNGTVYLPARAIAAAVGYDVGWNAEENTVILAPNNFLSGEEKAGLGRSALRRYYGPSDVVRLDETIGQAAFYDCMVTGEDTHTYVYDPVYASGYEGYDDMMEDYSAVLQAIDYGELTTGKNSNGDHYAIFENEKSGYRVTVSELTGAQTSTYISVTVEPAGGRSASRSAPSGAAAGPSASSASGDKPAAGQDTAAPSAQDDAAYQEAYRQAYTERRLAEKAAREKYGPDEAHWPESVKLQMENDYRNALNGYGQ